MRMFCPPQNCEDINMTIFEDKTLRLRQVFICSVCKEQRHLLEAVYQKF